MNVSLVNANAIRIPLANGSVHMVASSPPYWGLRDYGNPDQLGQEELHDCLAWAKGEPPCGRCFVCAIRVVAAEVWRVLRDDGTFWLNLGDSYVGGKGQSGHGDPEKQAARIKSGESMSTVHAHVGGKGKTRPTDSRALLNQTALKPKDLALVPARVALALQADGWYVRQDIIWAKPNPMPESVTDRCTKSHEYIFLLTKSARYYYDHEAIKVEAVGALPGNVNHKHTAAYEEGDETARLKSGLIAYAQRQRSRRDSFKREGSKREQVIPGQSVGTHRPDRLESEWDVSKRNRRSVWWVSTKGYPGAHFAVWPPDLVEPMIKAGTSEKGVCPECGAPWARVIHKGDPQPTKSNPNPVKPYEAASSTQANGSTTLHMTRTTETMDWRPTCDCGCQETVPAIVLDIFAGSGTTLQEARSLGRFGVGLDISFDYLVNEARTRLELDVLEAWENGAGIESAPIKKTAVKVPKAQMPLL